MVNIAFSLSLQQRARRGQSARRLHDVMVNPAGRTSKADEIYWQLVPYRQGNRLSSRKRRLGTAASRTVLLYVAPGGYEIEFERCTKTFLFYCIARNACCLQKIQNERHLIQPENTGFDRLLAPDLQRQIEDGLDVHPIDRVGWFGRVCDGVEEIEEIR
jgi:hypothetical protein